MKFKYCEFQSPVNVTTDRLLGNTLIFSIQALSRKATKMITVSGEISLQRRVGLKINSLQVNSVSIPGIRRYKTHKRFNNSI